MNNKITFPELVEQVAQYANTSKRMSELFLKELFATISQSLIDGESVKVKGIGTFKLTEVSARKSVDVNTGEEIEIPGHKKLSFAPDKSMAEAINQPFMHFETEILDDDVTDAQLAAIDAEEKAAGNEDSAAEPQEQELPPVFVAPPADDEPAEAEPVAEEAENEENAEAEAEAEETPAPSSEPEPAVEPEPSAEEPEPVEESEPSAEEPEPEPEPAEEIAPAESAAQEMEPEPESSEAEPAPAEVAAEADDAAVAVPEDDLTEERVSQEIDKRKITRRSLFEGFVVGVVTTLIVTFFAYRLYLTKGYNKEAEPAVEQPIAQGELTDTVADAQPALAQTAAEAKAEQQKAEAEQQQKAAEEKQKAAEEKKKAEAEKAAAAPAGGGTTDTIRSGTNLYRMSRKHYGSDKYWVYIYEENKAKYPNPNAIPVGAVLRVPRLEKYGVKAGDAAGLKAAKAKQAEIFNHLNKQ